MAVHLWRDHQEVDAEPVQSITDIECSHAELLLVYAPDITSGDSLVEQLDARGKLVQSLTLDGSGPLGPLAIQLVRVTAHGLWGMPFGLPALVRWPLHALEVQGKQLAGIDEARVRSQPLEVLRR